MGGILLQKPEVLQTDEPNPLLSMKPAKTEEYKYAAGETRLRIELEWKLRGEPPERREETAGSYIKQYRDLCDTIYLSLKDAGVGPDDEAKFAAEICSVFYSNMKFGHKGIMFIHEFLDSGKLLDCDVSSFMAFDIGRRLGISGLEIVSAPEHVFVRTTHWGFETTQDEPSNCVFPISEIDGKYPIIFMSTSDIEKMQAITYYERACARGVLGDSAGAIADYDKAIRSNPNYTDAFYGRGYSKNNLGDFRGAIGDYDIVIRLNPNYANAFNNRGWSKANLGDFEGAIKDYGKAIELNPNHAKAYHNRAIARKHSGNLEGYAEDTGIYEKLSKQK